MTGYPRRFERWVPTRAGSASRPRTVTRLYDGQIYWDDGTEAGSCGILKWLAWRLLEQAKLDNREVVLTPLARVARALCGDAECGCVNGCLHPHFREQAKRAVAAMREPSDAMLDAWPDYEPSREAVAEGWRCLVDAAHDS